MRPVRLAVPLVAVMLASMPAAPSAVAAGSDEVRLPPARVGDRWSISLPGDRYELEVAGEAPAVDRLGRLRPAFTVDVGGFHPVAFESKQLTRHRMHIDAASGVQIADVAEYVFGGTGGVTSDPAAYSAYEPNDPDGWPGWVQAGGLLAGRAVTPGTTIELPFVMTNTRGADHISLSIDDAPGAGDGCIRAAGETQFPSYTYVNSDGYQRKTLGVGLDITHCESSPYAARTRVSYSGAFQHSVEFSLESFELGSGVAIGTEAYEEPAHHVMSPPVPFGGRLRDGGAVEVPSIEAAQDAAALAPGLVAWRVLHPGGYLAEAELLPSIELPIWRLVHAAPGGAQHEVRVAMAGPVLAAVDVPIAEPYPATVPSLGTWPEKVASLSGILIAWRGIAGSGARLEAIRWQPLLDDNWYVTGVVRVTCDGEDCGTLAGEIPFDVETGAAGTGEHPVPAPA